MIVALFNAKKLPNKYNKRGVKLECFGNVALMEISWAFILNITYSCRTWYNESYTKDLTWYEYFLQLSSRIERCNKCQDIRKIRYSQCKNKTKKTWTLLLSIFQDHLAGNIRAFLLAGIFIIKNRNMEGSTSKFRKKPIREDHLSSSHDVGRR